MIGRGNNFFMILMKMIIINEKSLDLHLGKTPNKVNIGQVKRIY
jgi:hypothetical protein